MLRRLAHRSLLVLAAVAAAAPPGAAVLGEDAGTARERAAQWLELYGAEGPHIDADAKGRVVRECWAAPSRGWTRDAALEFAARLLPPAARGRELVQTSVTPTRLRYTVEGGYRIALETFGPRVLGVQVAAGDFDGDDC